MTTSGPAQVLVLEHPDGASSRARAFVRHLLHHLPELVDDAQLVVSELVTNAVLHAGVPVTVRARLGLDGAPDGLRLEVLDVSAERLVLPSPSPETMTGRGLALVAALSRAWGVVPGADGGKTVWAELAPGTATDPAPPGIEPAPGVVRAGDVHTVRLGAVPTDLLLAAKRHIDNVVRELTLERTAQAHGALTPPGFDALIATVTGTFAEARASIKEQAAAAAAAGEHATELVLHLPVSSVQAGEEYLAALDEADRHSRSARLLTLETPLLHRLFRRWYVSSLIEQLRAVVAGQEPVPPLPFVQVLADEVEALAQLPPDAGPRGRLHPSVGPVEGQVRVGGSQDRQLLSLADAARAIAGARSVEDLLEVVTETACSVVGCHQGVGTRLYAGSWQGAATFVFLSDRYAEHRDYDVVPQGLGVLNVVTRENRALRLTSEQLLAHPEFRGLRDAPGHPPLPDYLAAPFTSRSGDNIGLLQLSDKVDGTAFTEADEAICVQLALMVSSALEHLEVAGEMQVAVRRLRREREVVDALHDVGRAVVSRLERDEVVQVVTDAATTMTTAQFGAFFYDEVDDDGQRSSRYTVSGVPREAFASFPMPGLTEIFAPTFAGQGVLRLADVTTDPRFGLTPPHHGMPDGHLPVRSYLAVPVVLPGGEAVGGLFFGHADVGVFDETAERLALGIAGYAGIALENGRLYDAARRESRARQLVAAALEKPLQPPALPSLPGVDLAAVFQPYGGQDHLAGDFYDVFALSDQRWMLVLGDVSGKGPEAAAVAGLVRHTLWAAAQLSTDPVTVMGVVNAALVREDSERFATLVLAVVETGPEGARVDAVWAGHPPGLVLSPEGVQQVSAPGMPVGLFAQATYEAISFTVSHGQTLVLHTDGLVERADIVLTDDEIAAAFRNGADLDPEDLLAGVVAAVDGRSARRDDVAALALRVRPTAG